MRQLHVLGVSDDGATLLLGPTRNTAKPTHRIPLDDRLRAAMRGQLVAGGGDRAESSLSPKEMQARMRAGASPEEIAKLAGVPVARVIPYFAPVEAERSRIVDEARAAVMHRHRGPDGSHPLGELVDGRLRETTGIKVESITWSARRRPDGAWVVTVAYVARGRRKAEWMWRPAGRELTPLDALATRLGSEPKPAQRKAARKVAAAKPAAKRPAAKKAAPKKAATKKAAATRTTAKKAAATKAAATKTAVKRAAAPKPATPKRAVAAKKAPVTKPAPAKAARKRPTVVKPRKVAAKAARPIETRPVETPTVVAPPPEQIAEVIPITTTPPSLPEPPQHEQPHAQPEPAVAAANAPGRKPGQRVPLPSWSDVLLGVTRRDTPGDTPNGTNGNGHSAP